jgi:hypothetical protein
MGMATWSWAEVKAQMEAATKYPRPLIALCRKLDGRRWPSETFSAELQMGQVFRNRDELTAVLTPPPPQAMPKTAAAPKRESASPPAGRERMMQKLKQRIDQLAAEKEKAVAMAATKARAVAKAAASVRGGDDNMSIDTSLDGERSGSKQRIGDSAGTSTADVAASSTAASPPNGTGSNTGPPPPEHVAAPERHGAAAAAATPPCGNSPPEPKLAPATALSAEAPSTFTTAREDDPATGRQHLHPVPGSTRGQARSPEP